MYIDYFCVVAGNGCHFSFLGDDVKRDGEGAIHLLVEVGVVAEVGAFEEVLHLRGGRDT
jgi:hypothetical protein